MLFSFYSFLLRIAKIALFILFISFYFAFTALFFNDSIMREIYKYKGNTNAAVHIPNIILSSLFCIIMNFIVRFISLSERDISKINNIKVLDERKKLSRKIEKIYKIKLYVLFALSSILIAPMLVLCSCFLRCFQKFPRTLFP